MSEVTATESRTTVRPFTVELGYKDANHDIYVQTLNERLRGSFSLGRLKRRDVGAAVSGVPDMPGVRIEVVASKNRVRIYDPLTLPEYEDRMATYNRARQQSPGLGGSNAVGPIKERTIQLGPNKVKTLCDELLHLVTVGHAELVGGALPTVDQLKSMPGEFLNDPWNNHPSKPKFREASLSDQQVEDM